MSFSGRYPEQDICENFNAIDVRELQRKTRLRPGLCFIQKWVRNGAPAGETSRPVFALQTANAKAAVATIIYQPPDVASAAKFSSPLVWTRCRGSR